MEHGAACEVRVGTPAWDVPVELDVYWMIFGDGRVHQDYER